MNEPRRRYVGDLTIEANKEKGVIEVTMPNPERHASLTLQLWPADVRKLLASFIAASKELGTK